MYYLRQFFPSKLKPLEKVLLGLLLEQQADVRKDKLVKQIESINFIQRHMGGKEVNFYRIKKGGPYFDEQIRIDTNKTEEKICTIDFSIEQNSTEFKADIWVVNGFLFSITFDKCPEKISKANEVIQKRIWVFNKMLKVKSEVSRLSEPCLPSLISEKLGKYIITDLKPKLRDDLREEISRNIDTSLPQDYLEVLNNCDGFVLDDWKVFGLANMYNIVLPSGSYYVLAEWHGERFLLAKDHSNDGQIYYVSGCDYKPAPIGFSFVNSLFGKL